MVRLLTLDHRSRHPMTPSEALGVVSFSCQSGRKESGMAVG